jgi:hypothetical protein
MAIRVSRWIVAASALAALSLPAWAAHRDTANWSTTETTTIGSKTLSPGNYEFRAEEDAQQLQILQNGKVVAEVPIHWYQLSSKPSETEILASQNNVTEVHFAGRTDAIKVDSAMANEHQ